MSLNPSVVKHVHDLPAETKEKLLDMIDHISGVATFLMVSKNAVLSALAAVPQAELSALRTTHQLGTLVIGKLQHRLMLPGSILEDIMTNVDSETTAEQQAVDFSEFTLLRELVEEVAQSVAD